jgi:hypothetical protein
MTQNLRLKEEIETMINSFSFISILPGPFFRFIHPLKGRPALCCIIYPLQSHHRLKGLRQSIENQFKKHLFLNNSLATHINMVKLRNFLKASIPPPQRRLKKIIPQLSLQNSFGQALLEWNEANHRANKNKDACTQFFFFNIYISRQIKSNNGPTSTFSPALVHDHHSLGWVRYPQDSKIWVNFEQPNQWRWMDHEDGEQVWRVK